MRGGVESPRKGQAVHIGGVDLIERAEAAARVIAVVGWPRVRGRFQLGCGIQGLSGCRWQIEESRGKCSSRKYSLCFFEGEFHWAPSSVTSNCRYKQKDCACRLA